MGYELARELNNADSLLPAESDAMREIRTFLVEDNQIIRTRYVDS